MYTFPWTLLFGSLAAAAAIPAHSITPTNGHTGQSAGVFVPSSASQSASAQSARPGDFSHLAKREPYYFPETVPSDDEINERLTALREAGLVPSSQSETDQQQNSKLIDTPDAVIDIPHAQIKLPNREPSPNPTSHGSMMALTWETSPIIFPSLGFLIFAAVAACIATVIRGVKQEHGNLDRPPIALDA